MLKKVRRRPRHNTALSVKCGVVYLKQEFIGTRVIVLPESQYRQMKRKLKNLRQKITKIKALINYEYTSA